LVFNRPETTQMVFSRIREIKPKYLFIASDGPRKHVVGEFERCQSVQNIVKAIDWDCEIQTLFRKYNLGVREAISTAITWFFDNVDMGIILEDDIVPDLTFFKFCEELLIKYKSNNDVFTISGINFQRPMNEIESYYFSSFMHCWGWASWKSSWDKYNHSMEDWPKLRNTDFLQKKLKNKRAVEYWKRIFDKVYKGEINSWAYIWTFSIWMHNGINILPNVNLIKNIGFGLDSTNTKDIKSMEANLKTTKIDFPLQHPKSTQIDENKDKNTQRIHFQKPLTVKLKQRMRYYLNKV
jgi:hypothetical protein